MSSTIWPATPIGVTISNNRLVAVNDSHVIFHGKDYAHGSKQRTMTLLLVELI